MSRQRRSHFLALGGLLGVALTAWCACGSATGPAATADPGSRRQTRSGAVVGFQGRYNSHAWLGIPYAKPPVGPLRWRAPQPPEPWSSTRQALVSGTACPQYASQLAGVGGKRPGTPIGSEDCLYLNVWAPRLGQDQVPAGAARLPVMVWIHGGGNTIGEGGFYNGGNLAATHKLIVIAVNYRLGPFGWFRHAALRADAANDAERSGNFGTLDLVRALEWVRDNAEAFGGDPDNVTIFGESAGGTNVFSLLLSPMAQGLFHRAIVQSGGLRWRTAAEAEHFFDDADPGHARSSGEALARLLVEGGQARDRAGAKARAAAMDAAETARLLRGKTAVEILKLYPPQEATGMIDMPLVFRDGFLLPDEDPLGRLGRAGGYNRVPVMLGTTRDEAKLFMFADPAHVRRWFWIIPRLRDERLYNLTAEYQSKIWKAQGADEPAAAMHAGQGSSVFVYRFDWDEEPRLMGADVGIMLGAAHFFDVPFVFGHFDIGREGNRVFTDANEAGREALAGQMMGYWAQFAYAGAPGRGRDGRQPEWLPWDGSSPNAPKFIVLDTPAGGGARMSSEALTTRVVLDAVDTDPRLPAQADKCRIYGDLAKRTRGFTEKDYAMAGRNGCREFPLEGRP